MTSNNYVTILGWMTNLDLRGNELIVYAIIHGFSQDKHSYFYGSLSYLSEWTNVSVQSIVEILKKLVDRGLLVKVEREGKTNLYRSVNPFEEKINKEEPKKEEVKEESVLSKDEMISKIISYLNEKTNSRYRLVNSTKKLILSKLLSGYTVDDFYSVINVKCDEWLNNPDFCKYLRPQTLFGGKFDTYLNQAQMKVSHKHKEYNIQTNTEIADKHSVSIQKVY